MKNWKRILAASLATTTLIVGFSGTALAASSSLSVGGSANLQAVGTNSSVHLQDGIYFISVNGDISQCLNVQYRKTSGGLVLDPLNYEDNELWILKNQSGDYFTLSPVFAPSYYISGQENDKQLKLNTGAPSAGKNQWYAVADGDKYVIVNKRTGLAIDSAHGYTSTGNKVLNYYKNGYQAAQSWTMGMVSEYTDRQTPNSTATLKDGLYAIKLNGTNKALNTQYAVKKGNGTAKIVLDTYNGESNEQWYIKNAGNGRVVISPKHSTGTCLNVWAANPLAGSQLTLATYQSGDECSQWIPYKNSDGSYSFMNVKTHLFLNDYYLRTNDGNPVVAYWFDDSAAMRWSVTKISDSGSSSTSSSTASSGYASYNGVNYRSQTSSSKRIAACNKAVKMATVLWTSPCDFVTWKSSSGSYNTVTATDGTSAKKFRKGKTYQGIPYSMAGRTYDDSRWLSLVNGGSMTTSNMTGKYYTSKADTTGKGIDCSYLVCTALNAGCGTSINLNTSSMLSSSSFKKISRSSMLPGDIFLKKGHVMLYMGKTSSGKYAVIEANASYSRVIYKEYSSGSLGSYGSYRYTKF